MELNKQVEEILHTFSGGPGNQYLKKAKWGNTFCLFVCLFVCFLEEGKGKDSNSDQFLLLCATFFLVSLMF